MKPRTLINEIKKDKNEFFGYSHFHQSNMADYTLMSATIEDLNAVYNMNEHQAIEVIEALTH